MSRATALLGNPDTASDRGRGNTGRASPSCRHRLVVVVVVVPVINGLLAFTRICRLRAHCRAASEPIQIPQGATQCSHFYGRERRDAPSQGSAMLDGLTGHRPSGVPQKATPKTPASLSLVEQRQSAHKRTGQSLLQLAS